MLNLAIEPKLRSAGLALSGFSQLNIEYTSSETAIGKKFVIRWSNRSASSMEMHGMMRAVTAQICYSDKERWTSMHTYFGFCYTESGSYNYRPFDMYYDVQNGGINRGGIFGAAMSIQMGPAVLSMMTFRRGKGAASRWTHARSYQNLSSRGFIYVYTLHRSEF